MVHSDGPQFPDITAVVGQENAAGQRFLIGDASLGWNPSSTASKSILFRQVVSIPPFWHQALGSNQLESGVLPQHER
jgi:hypothetical protein